MADEMKGFWKYFILIAAGSALSLAGAIIGKTVLGYILYGLGLAAALAGLVFCFIKKGYFKADRRRPLILGLALSLLLASSAVLLTSNSGRIGAVSSNNSILSQFSGAARQGLGGSTNFSGRTGTDFANPGANGNFPSRFGTGTTGTGTNSTTTSTFNTTAAAAMRKLAARRIAFQLVGWVFLAAGSILLLVALIRFFTKKTNYTQQRWQTLLLGLVLGGLLAASTTLMVSASAARPGSGNFTTLPSGAISANLTETAQATISPSAGQTATALAAPSETAATATSTPIPTATSTPLPTITATTELVTNLVVCLSSDIQYGINIHDFPGDTAAMVGSIPAASCFTVNGRSAQYPGWYILATGQNGMGGIIIGVDEATQQLWVSGKTIETAPAMLSTLPVVEPIKK